MKAHRFGARTALLVSELVLGSGLAGDDPEGIFKAFVDAGGNAFDTSDAYQRGEAERALGAFVRPIRDDIVLVSKYGRSARAQPGPAASGSARKVMVQSVEASLRRLGTDRIEMAYSPLASGVLTGKYRAGHVSDVPGRIRHPEDARGARILDEVIAIAGELGCAPGQVALAWALAQGVFPVIGPRSPAQIADNLAATSLALSAAQRARLDAVSHTPPGYPHELLAQMRASRAGA